MISVDISENDCSWCNTLGPGRKMIPDYWTERYDESCPSAAHVQKLIIVGFFCCL